jgi:hypothetical protein
MSNPNYTLEIISHHPQFDNKSLRKYYVDGIDTVGAWGNEPFEIRFKNNTWQKIQVKLSVDGTDVFTGKPADTNVSDKMWVVNGYETLSLKAWPENNNGGAGFVFTSANNSVAVHTHGNLSSRGIIAAAVFVEGHVEPVRVNPYPWIYNPYIYTYPYQYDITGPTWMVLNGNANTTVVSQTGGVAFNNSNSIYNVGQNSLGSLQQSCGQSSTFSASMDNVTLDAAPAASDRRGEVRSRKLESLVAVGAGQHVDQKISYVSGLIKPVFTETVRVRYLWWDDLVAALRKHNVPEPHASGFPGDNQRNINLGSTPRLPKHGSFRRSEPMSYQRV